MRKTRAKLPLVTWTPTGFEPAEPTKAVMLLPVMSISAPPAVCRKLKFPLRATALATLIETEPEMALTTLRKLMVLPSLKVRVKAPSVVVLVSARSVPERERSLMPSISPGYGFAGIIVAFLGRLQPVGILFASLLMALLYLGGESLQITQQLPLAATGVIQGMLLLFLLAADVLTLYRPRWVRRRAHG